MRTVALAALGVALILTGCNVAESGTPTPTAPALVGPSATASPTSTSDVPHGTQAYDASDVVQSVTVQMGTKWDGVTSVLPGAERGIGYELTGCDSPQTAIMLLTVDDAAGRPVDLQTPLGEPKGYLPLVGLGSSGGGNAYHITARPSVPCGARLDFVSRHGSEGEALLWASGSQAGSKQLTTLDLPAEWTMMWSVRCTQPDATFKVAPVGKSYALVDTTLSTADRHYGAASKGGNVAGALTLNVSANGCYWYLLVFA